MKLVEKQYILSLISFPADEWFEEQFHTSINHHLMVLMIHRVLMASAKGESFPLANSYLSKYISNDTQIKNFINEICRAFNIEKPGYSKIKHLARSIQIEQDLAKSLLHEWHKRINTSRSIEFSKLQLKKLDNITSSRGLVEYNDDYAYIHNYLNNSAENEYGFDWDSALAIAKSEADIYGDVIISGAKRLYESKMVRYHEELGRLYTYGFSLQNVPKKYRPIICPPELGFYQVDLKSFHASVFAKIYNIESLQKALLEPVDYRSTIANSVGISKDQVKLMIQMLCYGSGKDNIHAALIPDPEDKHAAMAAWEKSKNDDLQKYAQHQSLVNKYNTKELFNELLKIPCIRDLYKVMKKPKDPICDAYGSVIPDFDKVGTRSNVMKKLSFMCGTYEKKSLMPFYHLAETTEMKVVADIHDGLLLHSAKKNLVDSGCILSKLSLESSNIPSSCSIHS